MLRVTFLNGYTNENIYVKQPPNLKNPQYENHVFKLTKALYGLKQAPRACYERLSKFLIEERFKRG